MLTWHDILKFVDKAKSTPIQRINSSQEWQQQLTPEQYRITRQKGTESPFSSILNEDFDEAKYHCICCHEPLFDSTQKFLSKSGWPSFSQPISEDAIAYHADDSLGTKRVEITCNRCDAHLGHVFPDGPEPSGLRYCVNGLALKKLNGGNNQASC